MADGVIEEAPIVQERGVHRMLFSDLHLQKGIRLVVEFLGNRVVPHIQLEIGKTDQTDGV